MPLPSAADLTIGFAHAAYRIEAEFATRGHPARTFEVDTLAGLEARVHEADVLVVSGLWRNHLVAAAPRLRFVQSISAGTDQYDRAAFAAAGIGLASGHGVNANAVAEHAMALILALTRQVHLARDNQAARHWRPMLADRAIREDELGGKTLAIIGLGRIGQRLAKLANAFDMRVIGVRRQSGPVAGVEAALPPDRLAEALAQADIVALTCPLTPETEGLIDASALAAMKPTALLVNVARGRVVDEPALIAALGEGRIAGAGLDVAVEEPLPESSPLWAMPRVIVTPHSAGETRAYETNVVDLLLENLGRIERGGEPRNAVG